MKFSNFALTVALIAAPAALPATAGAQALDFSGGGKAAQPIRISALNGISWNQKDFTVTARGDAKAMRGDVTVTADKLVAHYRPKAGQPAAAQGPAGGLGGLSSGASEITQLDAVGHVHIFTATEQALGDLAVYHMDRHELVLTGKGLKLTTPTETVTARDSIEYWSAAHKAVARGDATITGKDGRSISADTLTGYFVASGATGAAAPGDGQDSADQAAGKLREVTADGHVLVRTPTDVASGDHGVYHPATGIAILTGHVHVTHGPNELAGAKAEVNVRTGIATLVAAPGKRVEGLVIPGSNPGALGAPAPKSPQSQPKPAQ